MTQLFVHEGRKPMVKLTDFEREFIIENLENGEKLVETDNVNDILIPLDGFIFYEGFENDQITDRGREIQKIYDNIYYNNS